MDYINRLSCEFDAKSTNEGLARTIVSAFAVMLDPTLEELADLRTAVSEAVTNSIIHGYGDRKNPDDKVYMDCTLYDDKIEVIITDHGCGIADLSQAMQPMYTSAPDMERSGMGFTVMGAFTNQLEVKSEVGQGTVVKMVKVYDSKRKE